MILIVSNAAELDVSNRDCATPYQEDTWYSSSHLVGLFFRAVVKSQIVVPQWSPSTITLLQLKPMTLALIPYVDCKLYYTSKPISDEEDTLKSFMTFNIAPHGPIFRVIEGIRIVVPPIGWLW